MTPLFGAIVWGYDVVNLVIAVIVIVGIVVIGYYVLEWMEVKVAPILKKIAGVVLVVFVAVVAIKILATLL